MLSFVLGVGISPIRFHLEGWGCGKVQDGVGYFGIESYRSTYFTKLWFAKSSYHSTEKANEVFTAIVNSSNTIVDKGLKYDQQGVKVGERAVAVMLDSERNEKFAVVSWTHGPNLYSVGSCSMAHVLQFEKYRNADE